MGTATPLALCFQYFSSGHAYVRGVVCLPSSASLDVAAEELIAGSVRWENLFEVLWADAHAVTKLSLVSSGKGGLHVGSVKYEVVLNQAVLFAALLYISSGAYRAVSRVCGSLMHMLQRSALYDILYFLLCQASFLVILARIACPQLLVTHRTCQQ
eukprot:jgi/Botrbrau1/658/Bobra.0161s0046.2